MTKKEDRDINKQKLVVLTQSLSLVNYTATITSNQNVFTSQFHWMTSIIQNETVSIYRCLRQANELNIHNEYQDRKNLQKNAIVLCKNLKADIMIAHKLFHLKTTRVLYWTSLVDEIISLTKRWIDSDKKRKES